MILGILFLILLLIIWSWAITDLLKSRLPNSELKPLWMVIILFFPVIGSLLYFQLKKKMKSDNRRVFQPDFKTSAK
ncbi:PLD nuclease N-terminal domain-containing protein [Autumnicola musiva]|uniref:PLD nuclease N-terminal domain-containing protein n=1 Tax=Autumnicola musiva TaxID=3075589 RepID=UPI003D775306